MPSNASTSTETMTLGVSLEGAVQVLIDMIVLRETITLNSMLIVLNMVPTSRTKSLA
jgi:hypothetical protein